MFTKIICRISTKAHCLLNCSCNFILACTMLYRSSLFASPSNPKIVHRNLLGIANTTISRWNIDVSGGNRGMKFLSRCSGSVLNLPLASSMHHPSPPQCQATHSTLDLWLQWRRDGNDFIHLHDVGFYFSQLSTPLPLLPYNF